MKTRVLAFLLLYPFLSAGQQTYYTSPADTLQVIVVKQSRHGGTRQYWYGDRRFISPALLRPYLVAAGDLTTLGHFDYSRRQARLGNALAISGHLVLLSGTILFVAGGIAQWVVAVAGSPTALNSLLWTGAGVIGGGFALSIPGGILLRSSRRQLDTALERYNQSRRPRVSWQVVPTGTGLRLVGIF